jgi:hypothetical protein
VFACVKRALLVGRQLEETLEASSADGPAEHRSDHREVLFEGSTRQQALLDRLRVGIPIRPCRIGQFAADFSIEVCGTGRSADSQELQQFVVGQLAECRDLEFEK